MKGQRRIALRTVVAIALAGFAPGAFAYLDPSTGSMILSAIVGVFATLLLAIKTYWYKLKSFFNGRADQSKSSGESKAEKDSEDNGGA